MKWVYRKIASVLAPNAFDDGGIRKRVYDAAARRLLRMYAKNAK